MVYKMCLNYDELYRQSEEEASLKSIESYLKGINDWTGEEKNDALETFESGKLAIRDIDPETNDILINIYHAAIIKGTPIKGKKENSNPITSPLKSISVKR